MILSCNLDQSKKDAQHNSPVSASDRELSRGMAWNFPPESGNMTASKRTCGAAGKFSGSILNSKALKGTVRRDLRGVKKNRL
jgi:hypothetical protein